MSDEADDASLSVSPALDIGEPQDEDREAIFDELRGNGDEEDAALDDPNPATSRR